MRPIKVFNNDTNGYNETIKYDVLMCTNVIGNNHKFYCIELQKNSNDDYRVFTHYGRLGASNIYEVRDDYSSLYLAEKDYDSILKKKLKGKTIKPKDGGDPYKEQYVIVDTFAPTVGSKNIRQESSSKRATVKVNNDLGDIKAEYKEKEVSRIINQVIDENVHSITSTMDVTLTSNGFETPLGPVTIQHIEKATLPLNELKDIIESNEVEKRIKDIRGLNTQFFSLIPHKFGHRITDFDLIKTSSDLLDKFDLLEMLKSSVQMGDTLTQGSEAKYNALGAKIAHVLDSKIIDRLKHFVYSTKASNHTGLNVWNIDVLNIFELELPDERKRFNNTSEKIGNVMELFHGSRNCNILSILKNGLKIFPSHPTKAGDMFGVGLYFANNSTKSANYSTGYWGRVGNKYSNNFLFIADVAMGNIKEEHRATMKKAPAPYDSTKGCKGSSLYNDEFIVYREEQATLKYLIEFKC